jgi:hypothetical protein
MCRPSIPTLPFLVRPPAHWSLVRWQLTRYGVALAVVARPTTTAIRWSSTTR